MPQKILPSSGDLCIGKDGEEPERLPLDGEYCIGEDGEELERLSPGGEYALRKDYGREPLISSSGREWREAGRIAAGEKERFGQGPGFWEKIRLGAGILNKNSSGGRDSEQ